MPYLIDTDAIAHIKERPNYEEVYAILIREIEAGQIFTVEQVFDELRRWPDIQDRFLPYKKTMEVAQYIGPVMEHVGYISEAFPDLYDLTGTKNPDPADPWLIGCAKHYGYCLVTDERPSSIKRIPFVCRQQGVDVECINGLTLIARLNGG